MLNLLPAGVREPAADLQSLSAGGARAAQTHYSLSVPDGGSEGKGHGSVHRVGR